MPESTLPRLIELSPGYEIDFGRDTVTRCSFDYAFTLLLGETETLVVIEAPFVLEVMGISSELNPEDVNTMARGLQLLRQTVSSCRVDEAGSLTIEFLEGAVLTAPVNSSYEAWHITSHNGLRLVCMPGGKIAVWLPQDP